MVLRMCAALLVAIAICVFCGCAQGSSVNESGSSSKGDYGDQQAERLSDVYDGRVSSASSASSSHGDAKGAGLDGGSAASSSAGGEALSESAFSRDALIAQIPVYGGQPWVEMNGNVPSFSDEDRARGTFESYSPLDELGRCGPAFALVGPETMPQTKRSSIGMVKPSGWQLSQYDWVDGRYLFNRCHLVAFALSGENDNERNLITGTRSMNVLGMLPFEERVASYVDRTGNHVLYRVTPVFEGENLVASGVLMEAESIEDSGAGIRFCVWCYNVEPRVVIDYATGANREGDPVRERYDAQGASAEQQAEEVPQTYVLNTNTFKFHYPYCDSVSDMKDKNKRQVEAKRSDVIAEGYEPCGRCRP